MGRMKFRGASGNVVPRSNGWVLPISIVEYRERNDGWEKII
jgi:hypothetical protein